MTFMPVGAVTGGPAGGAVVRAAGAAGTAGAAVVAGVTGTQAGVGAGATAPRREDPGLAGAEEREVDVSLPWTI
jgi:hypothetical protein